MTGRGEIGVRLGYMLIAQAQATLAQTTGESASPAVVAIASIVGCIAGLILMSLIVSHARKQYEMWREKRSARGPAGADHLHWRASEPFIPYGDIIFQGADGYRLAHNDDIQTTPRSIEDNEIKRIAVAHAQWNGMHVAVKIIIRGSTTQAQRATIAGEVALVQSLMHPNCVRVFGLAEQPSQHVSLVTEWLEGGSLLEFLTRSPSAPEQHRLDIFINVCSAGAPPPLPFPLLSTNRPSSSSYTLPPHPRCPPPPQLNTSTLQLPTLWAAGWHPSMCTRPHPITTTLNFGVNDAAASDTSRPVAPPRF